MQITSNENGAFFLTSQGLGIGNILISVQSLQEGYSVSYSRDENLTYYYFRLRRIVTGEAVANRTCYISVLYI